MIIDIRRYEDYQRSHIPGAISIPASLLSRQPDSYIQKDQTYHLYCYSGKTSSQLVSYLNSLGYHCVNIEGGYSKYLLEHSYL